MNVAAPANDLPDPVAEAWKYTDLPAALRTLGPLEFETRDFPAIQVAAHETRDKPVEILVDGTAGRRTVGRLSVVLADNAQATVIERHEGEGAFWNDFDADITLAPGARLRHYRLQTYGPRAVYTQRTSLTLGRDAHYESFTLTTGAALSRVEAHARLTGPGAHCELNGVSLLDGVQHGDTTIVITHEAPHCASHQYFRTVLDGRARGVFQGKIHVERAAQKTDGYQLANALLLSEGAEMDIKPELEIYADDVKCSHGATTGQLDEQALFYLRSRGIDRGAARSLLIGAFVNETVDKISNNIVRDDFLARVAGWLEKKG